MKTEELIEDYLVYTDNGIERVHWCNVNGVKELVSPKGKVYGYVPDYFEVKRLQEQLNEANEVIKTTKMVSGKIDLSQLVYEDRRKIDGITMQTESYLKKYNIS